MTIASANGQTTEIAVLTGDECLAVAQHFPALELRRVIVVAVDDVNEDVSTSLRRIYTTTNRDHLFQELQLKYNELHQQHQALLRHVAEPQVALLSGPTSGGMT